MVDSDPLDLNLKDESELELRDLTGLSGSCALAVSSAMMELILLILSFTDIACKCCLCGLRKDNNKLQLMQKDDTAQCWIKKKNALISDCKNGSAIAPVLESKVHSLAQCWISTEKSFQCVSVVLGSLAG